MAREIGDKLGPRLARLVLNHQVAARMRLAPLEARISAAGTQQVIDRAGRETADHYRDIIGQVLGSGADLPPWLVEYLEQTASGEHQWRSVAGVLGLTGITGGLQTIISNAIAPAVQQLVRLGPSLHIDQNAAAQAAAGRILGQADAADLAAQAGYNLANFEALRELSRLIPDAPTLADLRNRGLLSQAAYAHYLGRLALPDDLIGPVSRLAEVILSPPDAALAVLRGNMSQAEGEAIAAANGVSSTDFGVLIGNTGEPPAMEEMLMLWRRGKISTATLDRAIRQSRVRDEWIPAIHDLATQPPSTAEVLEALVQGEISTAAAEKRYAEAGGDPTYFETAWRTRANSPSPVQLSEMANRGIIPWSGTGPGAVSFEQGVLEGRWKDKYLGAFRQLAAYIPPPREISTLVREGGLTEDQAMAYWRDHGMSAELAHTYWLAAHHTRTATLHELAAGEIDRLYFDQAVTRTEALKMLEGINWSEHDASYRLDLVDLKRERGYLEKAISRVSALYIGHKITRNQAAKALADLEVASGQAEHLIKIWDLEAADNVKTLTAAEIVAGWFYKRFTAAEAMDRLEAEGYTRDDAMTLLVIRNKGPLTG